MKELDQKIETLGQNDLQNLERARIWVRGHYTPDTQNKYDSAEGKLRVLQVILDEGWVANDETAKLQSLGVTFGDALSQKLDLIWVMVEDEYGRDPALMVPQTTILAYPLTAISKRIESGEKVDINDLFGGFCDLIVKRKAQDQRSN